MTKISLGPPYLYFTTLIVTMNSNLTRRCRKKSFHKLLLNVYYYSESPLGGLIDCVITQAQYSECFHDYCSRYSITFGKQKNLMGPFEFFLIWVIVITRTNDPNVGTVYPWIFTGWSGNPKISECVQITNCFETTVIALLRERPLKCDFSVIFHTILLGRVLRVLSANSR